MSDEQTAPAGEPQENLPADPRAERQEALKRLAVFAVLCVAAVLFWDRVRVPALFVVTLGILIFVHEWGHFIAAKAVGVRVYEFAFGFGPRLATYMRRGGTDYTIRAFPLGGFVNPKGMQPDDPVTPDGLNGRRPAERALVYLAGPLMNVILAVLVYCLAGAVIGGPDDTRQIVGGLEKRGVAEKMGLQVGDRILSVNGNPVRDHRTVLAEIHRSPGKEVRVEVERAGRRMTLTGTAISYTQAGEYPTVRSDAPPGALPVRKGDIVALLDGEYVGAQEPVDAIAEVNRRLREKEGQTVRLTVIRGGKEWTDLEGPARVLDLEPRHGERVIGRLQFVPVPDQGGPMPLDRSVRQGLQSTAAFFVNLSQLFNLKRAGESLGGPVQIYAVVGQAASLPVLYYISMFCQLSLSLAVFNLLPVPVLDGGHMMILTVEVLRRRRLEPQTLRAVHLAGLTLIGMLFVFIMAKDLLRQFG